MKYIKQAIIILTISAIGEILHYYIPLPIPASIYGMVLLFICLCTHIIKLNQIKNVCEFLIEIMPMLFIPSAVGIITQLDDLKNIWLEIAIITLVSTVLVMAVTGVVTQIIIKVKSRKEAKHDNRSV